MILYYPQLNERKTAVLVPKYISKRCETMSKQNRTQNIQLIVRVTGRVRAKNTARNSFGRLKRGETHAQMHPNARNSLPIKFHYIAEIKKILHDIWLSGEFFLKVK
jgi:hypothetical protein